MKKILFILSTLAALQSFAERYEMRTYPVKTVEDALFLGKRPCFDFKTTSLQGENATDVTNYEENLSCYIQSGREEQIQEIFYSKIRWLYGYSGYTSTTVINSHWTMRINAFQIDKALEETFKEIANTEHCRIYRKHRYPGIRIMENIEPIERKTLSDVARQVSRMFTCQ